jgi:hypothetical protein
VQEAESRVLGLEALVLHTQPKLSLYWHALLLWHVSMDDYLVREAIRDACHDEIRCVPSYHMLCFAIGHPSY